MNFAPLILHVIQQINIEGIPGGFCNIKNLNLGILNNIHVKEIVSNIEFWDSSIDNDSNPFF